MYDAIPEPNFLANKTTDPVDPEIAKFLPMLQEYLRSMPTAIVYLIEINFILVNDEPSNIASNSAKGDRGEEYVWDVFYHRPAITELAAVVNIATMCVTHHILFWQRTHSHFRSGLPPVGQYNSDPDSDSADDEDDEDSNSMQYDALRLVRCAIFDL